ncbi:MAG: tyrosine-type recombinase/integrase [Betaproteobacteria bacterium]
MVNFANDWKAIGPRFGSLSVDDITADICRSYAEDRQLAGKSVSTSWTELTRLRSCLNWAQKRRVIDRAPYVWTPTKPDGRTRVMSEDEVLALLDGCKVPHIRLFCILAITTAGRSGALLDLTWDRVDFEAGTIDLRKAVRINALTKQAQKGRAIVPMSKEARAALQDAKAGALTDHVIEWDGLPVKCIMKGFKAAAKAAGLKDVSPHTLRHTAATWLEEGDVDMGRISRLLGHRDRRTTEKLYSHPRPHHLQEAAEIIDMKIRRRK